MNKLLSILQLFKKGHVVANAELWKKRQITATVLGGVFVAVIQLLKAYGVDIPIDDETATALAAGTIAVINWILTIISSDKVGITIAEEFISNAQ